MMINAINAINAINSVAVEWCACCCQWLRQWLVLAGIAPTQLNQKDRGVSLSIGRLLPQRCPE
jgi:hypothetical protein